MLALFSLQQPRLHISDSAVQRGRKAEERYQNVRQALGLFRMSPPASRTVCLFVCSCVCSCIHMSIHMLIHV